MGISVGRFAGLISAMVMSMSVNFSQAQHRQSTEEFAYMTFYATKEPGQRNWLSRIQFKEGKIYSSETDTIRSYLCHRNDTKLEFQTGINDLNLSIDLASVGEKVDDISRSKVRFATRVTMFSREVYMVGVDTAPEKLTIFYIDADAGILGFGSFDLTINKSDYINTMYWLEGDIGLCHSSQ